ncbi:peptidyl-prolyl cis-trans isomerase, partial [Candidatus Poribacteria bacterium]|nr:peptidyl-prolyl cis-trans isomerase [Candidatus Poribacteria bacterium]
AGSLFGKAQAPRTFENALRNKEIADHAVATVALEDLAAEKGLVVTTEDVSEMYRGANFTADQYRQYLRREGRTEGQDVNYRKHQLTIGRAEGLIGSSARVSLLELWREYLLANEKLTADYAKVDVARYTEEVEATAAEIEKYFNEHPEDYQKREECVYRYVVVEAPPLPPPADLDDDDIRAMYEAADPAQDDRFADPGGILVRHILLEVGEKHTADEAKARLEELRALIESGKNMAALADENSDDLANIQFQSTEGGAKLLGGQLPEKVRAEDSAMWIERYGQEWYDRVIAMKPGELSPTLVTPLGAFLIKVENITAAGKKPLDEVYPMLVDQVRQANREKQRDAQRQMVDEKEEQVRQAVAESTTLELIARKLEVDVRETSPTLATRKVVPGIGDLSRDWEVIEDLKPGEVSPVLRTPSEALAVVQLKEVLEARPYKLDEVRERAERNLRRQKAREKAKSVADEMLAEVKSGDLVTSAALERGITASSVTEPFTRIQPGADLAQASSFPADTLGAKTGDCFVVEAGFGGDINAYLVVKLTSVAEPAKAEFLTGMANLERQFRNAKAQAFVEEFRKDAVSRLKPEYDEQYVREDTPRAGRRGRRS